MPSIFHSWPPSWIERQIAETFFFAAFHRSYPQSRKPHIACLKMSVGCCRAPLLHRPHTMNEATDSNLSATKRGLGGPYCIFSTGLKKKGIRPHLISTTPQLIFRASLRFESA